VINIEPGWILEAQKGKSEAFTKLVETCQTPVYNLCYRMLGDPYEAEDAAQETFLRAYNNLRHYDAKRSFSTWLLSIAAHYCIDQIRKRRMNLLSLDDAVYLDPPDTAPGPEASLSTNEEKKRMRVLLDTLSAQDRAAVIMLYWYDLSYEEIAEALSMTISSVKSRLHRARQAMAQSWSEQEVSVKTERRQNDHAQSPAF
jgi:RNA polymerase sigma-70 factor (ECF subfamily)